jgi:large subunit ribosomal protein L15
MMIHEITQQAGRHKTRKRLGRGRASGLGKTCGRGHKGQRSRSGSSMPITSEGGQMPLFRRLPKRGFNNANFTTRYAIVNVCDLDRFDDGTRIDMQTLYDAGLISTLKNPLKVLGDGELTHALTVIADKFSRTAREKITGAGGAAQDAVAAVAAVAQA